MHDPVKGIRARLVSGEARLVMRFGPAAIAIHDYC